MIKYEASELWKCVQIIEAKTKLSFLFRLSQV